MSEGFLGEIRLFGFDYAPDGWALCNGQLLSINEYDALYSLLGTTYGGDGISSFAVPDLRGRVPAHPGQTISIGQMYGAEEVTLRANDLPQHSHMLGATITAANTPAPTATTMVASASGGSAYVNNQPYTAVMLPSTGGPAIPSAGNQPHDNTQPSLVINFCINLYGIYPQAA